jgi:hypothetical protein
MDLLQLIRLWVKLEHRAADVRRLRDATGTTLSVTSAGPQTLALTWCSRDPLAIRVTVLAGLRCTSTVVSRDALRTAGSSGFGRRCQLVVAGVVMRPSRRQVRRLLDATDAVVPSVREAALVEVAADAFLQDVLGPVAPAA